MIVLPGVPILLLGYFYCSRRVAARFLFMLSRVALWIGGIRVTIIGTENIVGDSPGLLVGNHQSMLDIPLMLFAKSGDVRFFAKNSLFRIPIFGGLLNRYGFIAVDRSNARAAAASIEYGLQRLAQNPISIVVFPEGTRTGDGRLLPFRRGAMKICLRARMPVVPFVIEGAYRLNPRHGIAVRPGEVRITFLRAIGVDEVATMGSVELHDRVRSALLSVLDGNQKQTEGDVAIIGLDDAPLDEQGHGTATANS